jgi:hypothetical protein
VNQLERLQRLRTIERAGVARGTDNLRSREPFYERRCTCIHITDFENEYNTLYRNNGDWQFDDVSYKSGEGLPSMPYVKWGNAFFDVDNDGWLDLIFVSGHVYPQVATLASGGGYRQHGILQLNQGKGTFCNATDLAGPL